MIIRFAKATEPMRSNPPFAYSWGFVLLCVAFSARLLAGATFSGLPFLTFFPAVALAAFLCGPGPAIVVALGGGAMAGFFLFDPLSPLPISPAGAALAFLFYFATTALIIALVDALLKSLEREAAALEEFNNFKALTEGRFPNSPSNAGIGLGKQ